MTNFKPYYEVYACLDKNNLEQEQDIVMELLNKFYLEKTDEAFPGNIRDYTAYYFSDQYRAIVIHVTHQLEMAEFFTRHMMSNGICSIYIKKTPTAQEER